MPAKQLLFREDARFAIVRGVSEMAKAVKATLGPKGRHVLLERKPRAPLITKDGVAVAHELDLPDPYENMGVQLVREVAQQTGETTDDGTTIATVLADAILREGVKHVVAGASPTELKKGLDQAVLMVERELAALSKPCRSQQEIARVGTVSANGDPVLGHMIAQAMEQVGRDGLIMVEEGSGLETTLEVVEGMRFDRGYLSPSFVTDRERMEAVVVNPAILLCDHTLKSVDPLVPLLEMMAQQAQSLLVIADSVEGEALAALAMNKLRGRLQIAAVKTPGYGERRKALLQDVAVFTGGQVVSVPNGA
jgi:chaperonin GroEL